MMALCFYGSFAQIDSIHSTKATTASSELYFSYGPSYHLKVDKTYSRLAKNGFNHFANLAYKKLNDDRIIDVQVRFVYGILNTKGNDVNKINNYVALINLDYLRNIKPLSTRNLSVYAGINLGFKGDVWFPGANDLRYGWDVYVGAGIAAVVRYTLGPKLWLQYDLTLPLLGGVWRPHNNGQQLVTEEIQLEKGLLASLFETPRFAHPFNAFYVDNSIQLIYRATAKLYLSYNFILSYKNIKDPLEKKGYELSNAVGIAYKFKKK